MTTAPAVTTTSAPSTADAVIVALDDTYGLDDPALVCLRDAFVAQPELMDAIRGDAPSASQSVALLDVARECIPANTFAKHFINGVEHVAGAKLTAAQEGCVGTELVKLSNKDFAQLLGGGGGGEATDIAAEIFASCGVDLDDLRG